jgi:hypothetical protein
MGPRGQEIHTKSNIYLKIKIKIILKRKFKLRGKTWPLGPNLGLWNFLEINNFFNFNLNIIWCYYIILNAFIRKK